ncbi:MAG: hypothetical protein QOJ79_2739 [Actinomycetota bacterium]|jgi:hypothetical protein|nr:hypothetical protein [Actinomycetota bacterium]
MPSLRRTTKPAAKPPVKGKAKPVTKPSRGERAKQIKMAFKLTRDNDPRLVLVLVAAFLVPLVVFLGLGVLLGHPIYLGILGLLAGVLALVAVFGRRMQKMQYSQVEGQPGAAAAVLQAIRGNWRVTPAVQFTREQDLVHRVVGLPGVILVGEGNPGRTRGLIGNEKKKLARFLGDTPVYDVMIGDGDGQIALKALQRHLMKLPRNVKPARVNELDRMFKAMPTSLPIPKGAMPTRVPRGKMR